MPARAPRRARRLLSLLTSSMLAAGVVALVLGIPNGGGSRTRVRTPQPRVGRPGPTTTEAPAATTTTGVVPPALAALITELKGFAERTRGLKFVHEVPVSLLDDASFRKRTEELTATSAASMEKTQKVLRALGLITADVDLGKAVRALYAGAVVGLYDQKNKVLLVRGSQPTPLVRRTLAHELTHALQDQHFTLFRPELDSRDDESALAFSALVEGDAVRVEQAYQNTMSLADRDQLGREESAQLGQLAPSIPEVLIELVGFPYTYGPRYVQSVLSSAGQVRLDQAFTSPPTTTEQILHPDRWLAGDPPAPLAQPKADAAVIDKGVLGELGFDLVLQKVVGVDETRAALADWGGDQYVAWDASGRTCLRDTVTAGGGGSAAAMQRALRDYTRRRSGATLTGAAPDPMTFTVCA
ncbi:MAG: hypothetical protein E6G27_01350 [Actinobacteria bacterium]|nr:MAG: hypothetical protein E6G27_01350 [Actinomycetota bacterium]